MPQIWMPEPEWKALQAVLRSDEKVDWEAYERVRQYLLHPQADPESSQAESPARMNSE